jgi:hypothetical protein
MIKAHNLTSPQGNKVPNQIVITGDGSETFQSYGTTIATKNGKGVELDRKFWNYSRTTSKYRNVFLDETTKETEAKIKDGTYALADLN